MVVLTSSGLQVGLTGSQVWWATDVSIAFERVEEGFETALKDYNKKQVRAHFVRVNCCVSERRFAQRQRLDSVLTDHTVELSDPHAAGRAVPRRPAEDHDHLHHRRSRSRRGCQSDKSESTSVCVL